MNQFEEGLINSLKESTSYMRHNLKVKQSSVDHLGIVLLKLERKDFSPIAIDELAANIVSLGTGIESNLKSNLDAVIKTLGRRALREHSAKEVFLPDMDGSDELTALEDEYVTVLTEHTTLLNKMKDLYKKISSLVGNSSPFDDEDE